MIMQEIAQAVVEVAGNKWRGQRTVHNKLAHLKTMNGTLPKTTVFNWNAKDKYMELKSSIMEVPNIFLAKIMT